MQQSRIHPQSYPTYVERIVLFFTPDGAIVLKMGNGYIEASSDEVREIVETRLAQHQLFSAVYNRNGKEQP